MEVPGTAPPTELCPHARTFRGHDEAVVSERKQKATDLRQGWVCCCAGLTGEGSQHPGKKGAVSARAALRQQGVGGRRGRAALGRGVCGRSWDRRVKAFPCPPRLGAGPRLGCACAAAHACLLRLALEAKSSQVRSEAMPCYPSCHAPVKTARAVSSWAEGRGAGLLLFHQQELIYLFINIK